MNDLARLVTAVTDARVAGRTVLFLSDFDGTLSRIVDHPDAASLPPEVRDDLGTLARAPRTHVAVVSGRALADIRSRVGLRDVIYAGCHGLEIEGPGIVFTHPTADARREDLLDLARTLDRGVGLTAGVQVENKGLCVAVHYRRVAEADRDRVRARVDEALARRTGLSALPGRKVVDILPAVDWNKGHCAIHIRGHVQSIGASDITTVYLGDDTTDERACSMLEDEALTVRVGAGGGPTVARFRLADVSEVHRLVAALAANVPSWSPKCV